MESETLTAGLHAGELRGTREKVASLPVELIFACAMVGVWLIVAPRSPDLAAQAYRVGLWEHIGFVLWDNNWYAGHNMPGYSLTYPVLAALLGMRVVGAAAVVASVAIFREATLLAFGQRSRAATLWFAVAATGDLWIGRLSFALGVTFGLAAVLALLRGRQHEREHERRVVRWAAFWSALSAATSPVTGAFLLLCALAYWLTSDAPFGPAGPPVRSFAPPAGPSGPPSASPRPPAGSSRFSRLSRRGLSGRRVREPLALALPVLVVTLPVMAVFPEGGFEPYAAVSVISALAVTGAFLWALPRRERLLRCAAWLYVGANVAMIPPLTPMGSNVQRLAILFAGPLLLCALQRDGGMRAARRPRWAVGAIFGGIALWVLWGPVVQTLQNSEDPSTRAAYYAPLERWLATHHPGPVRVEVPFTRSHWEAALLAPQVELARGWERQLDKRYDIVLDSHNLTDAQYRGWLYGDAVSYVALPDVPLDGSSVSEARVITSSPPFLREVFHSAHWRVYQVLGAPPLARGPGRLTFLGHDRFALAARRAGTFAVRVHYTPWWTVTVGHASVTSSPGEWTEVTVDRPGRVVIAARLTLGGLVASLSRLV
ncbi:MAG: hypothetical protein FWD42_03860 [Solirubrobacterales bacterium]|nr:hypothetical protein [Solirubrobacterales bacterium]